MTRVRIVGFLVAASLSVPGALQGQEVIEPVFRAEARGDSVLLRIEVPEGWSLYAPSIPKPQGTTESGTNSGPERTTLPAGRPLRVLSHGQPIAPSTWPEPVFRSTVLGPARVHEAGSYVGVFSPADHDEIVIEWALCSEALCVPGRSRLSF